MFMFICLFAVGVMNVNAATVTVTTEQELKDALDGTDSSITLVKLGKNIELADSLVIYPVNDLVLDLNGQTIDGQANSKQIYVYYGKELTNNTGSLTIKDSSPSKEGTFKLYKPIIIYKWTTSITSASYEFTIDGGSFYVSDFSIFESGSSNYALDFTINDGYFECYGSGIFLHTGDMITNNRNLNVTLNKLTVKSSSVRLVYSGETNFKVSDVVSADSNIKLKHSTLNTEGALLTDRTLSVSELNAFSSVIQNYDTIEIIKAEGFDVNDITLCETYGYTSASFANIVIFNRGQNPLQVKNVSVSGSDLIVTGTLQPILEAGAKDNLSYTIKAKPGLNAGTYTAILTVTDMNDNTYTANVTLNVLKRHASGINIDMQDFMYGDTPSVVDIDYGDLETGQYVVEYSEKDAYNWTTTAPTKAGLYTVRLSTNDDNLVNQSWSVNYEIKKNNKEIQIIATSNEWTYDGNSHSDTSYIVKYDGAVVTGGVLPTGDKVTAVISASVKDVKDNVLSNNAIDSYTIENRDCYSNVMTTRGTIKIKPITTSIIVTAGSATKAYDGTELTKDSYTYTEGVLLTGDTLLSTITGSQTYVGTSSNIVSNVKVMRGDKDITSNYTFGSHVDGTLTVTAANQTLSIADQYVRVNGTLLTSELEDALTGAHGNVSFEKKSGTAGEYNKDTIGGFLAGSSLGTVVMTAKATAFDVNGDGTAEYNEAEEDFNIHIVTKETVTISGITDNQEFTYDGSVKTPTGTLTVSDDKVAVSDLEVSYVGTGSTTYSGTTAPKNAGTYKVTYKVPNTNADYVGEATFNFTIKKAQFSKVTLKHSSYIYTGEDIDLELNGFDGLYMSLLGSFGEFVPIVKNVKTYNFSVRLEDKNNYEWTDGTTNNIPLTFSVIKANPSYTVPTNLTGLKGQTLNDITLPTGFTWNNASTPLIVGTHTYTATYTPSDTKNYNIMNDIEITIVTKDVFNVTTSVTGGDGSINGPFMNVVEGSTKDIIFTPDEGFMIDKVLVNEVETTVSNNKLTLTVDEDKVVKVSYKKIPLTITVVDMEGVTITPNGIVSLNYGDAKEFTITVDRGYRLIKVLLSDYDITENISINLLSITVTENQELKVIVEKIVYDVVEGANQSYTVNEDNEAKFRIDAEYGMFEDGGEVYVDNVLVDSENYTSSEGSTIITLKQGYVDTLSTGEHTLKVLFADGGEATTKFTVERIAEELTPEINNPQTGDNIGLYITTGILSVLGLIFGFVFIIKRKQEN